MRKMIIFKKIAGMLGYEKSDAKNLSKVEAFRESYGTHRESDSKRALHPFFKQVGSDTRLLNLQQKLVMKEILYQELMKKEE